MEWTEGGARDGRIRKQPEKFHQWNAELAPRPSAVGSVDGHSRRCGGSAPHVGACLLGSCPHGDRPGPGGACFSGLDPGRVRRRRPGRPDAPLGRRRRSGRPSDRRWRWFLRLYQPGLPPPVPYGCRGRQRRPGRIPGCHRPGPRRRRGGDGVSAPQIERRNRGRGARRIFRCFRHRRPRLSNGGA